MTNENPKPSSGARHSSSSTSRRVTLSPDRRERKRVSDRISQQATRARTKAYIAHLERTTARLIEMNSGNGTMVSKQLKEQYEQIEGLKDVIAQIAKLATGASGSSFAGPGTYINPSLSRGFPPPSPHESVCKGPVQSTPAENRGFRISESFNLTSHPNQESLSEIYPTLNLVCGDQDRDYFEALNQALVTIEHNHAHHLFSGPEVDDDITIRAILLGWNAAKAKNPFDIGWHLLQSLDEGLFFRSGPVERIAILRIIRSMLMTQVEHSRLIDYFVWPEVRDYLIISSISYAPETLAAQFASDIGLIWPFDLRDTCKYQVSKDTYTFSKEFNEAYEDLGSWYFKSPIMAIHFPPLSLYKSATGSEEERSETLPQPWNPPHEARNQSQVWDSSWTGELFDDNP